MALQRKSNPSSLLVGRGNLQDRGDNIPQEEDPDVRISCSSIAFQLPFDVIVRTSQIDLHGDSTIAQREYARPCLLKLGLDPARLIVVEWGNQARCSQGCTIFPRSM